MKLIINICLAVLLLQSTLDVKAQDTTKRLIRTTPVKPLKPMVIKKPKPLHTELSAGIRLNTDGWGIYVDKGWVKSQEKYRDFFYDVKLLQVELDEKKHPSEVKRANTVGAIGGTNNDKPKPFIYGKKNNFYTFKIGYGGRKMLAGKPEPGNVSMHLVYLGGLSLGLLKPYYVSALAPISKGSSLYEVQDITYTDTTQQYFLDKQYIYGSSGFGKGLGQMKYIPGIHLKTALHFDFAANKTSVLAIETGVNFEYYSQAIELMANKEAKSYFLDAYVSVQFGKRW